MPDTVSYAEVDLGDDVPCKVFSQGAVDVTDEHLALAAFHLFYRCLERRMQAEVGLVVRAGPASGVLSDQQNDLLPDSLDLPMEGLSGFIMRNWLLHRPAFHAAPGKIAEPPRTGAGQGFAEG